MTQQHSFTWDAFLKADALPRWGRGCTATADIVATSVAKAKRRTNTVLTPEQWTQQGYARLPPSALEPPKGGEVLEQVDARYISSAEFSTRFMERKVPCVVTGATEAWRGRADWRCFETLAQRIGTKKFKVGNTEGGYGDERVSMRLRHFLAYCDAQSSADGDDSPLYIFEDEFGETAPALLEDYTAPHMFKEDLFAPPLLSEKRRPPHRWFLIGPARSGSGVSDFLGVCSATHHSHKLRAPPSPPLTPPSATLPRLSFIFRFTSTRLGRLRGMVSSPGENAGFSSALTSRKWLRKERSSSNCARTTMSRLRGSSTRCR